MYPRIYLDGPDSESSAVGFAILELHRHLIDRFGGQRGLDNAYVVALEAAEADEELHITERALTPFEEAFDTLAAQVHARHGFDSQSRFFFDLPF